MDMYYPLKYLTQCLFFIINMYEKHRFQGGSKLKTEVQAYIPFPVKFLCTHLA